MIYSALMQTVRGRLIFDILNWLMAAFAVNARGVYASGVMTNVQ